MENLLGRVFGDLTVVAHDRCSYWKCLCSCGKEKTFPSHYLLTGHNKSCGHLRNRDQDLTNQKFGKLLLLEKGIPTKYKARITWICQCDCGKIKQFEQSNLLNGTTKTCGCGRRIIKQDSGYLRLFTRAKLIAKQRKKEFSLDYETFLKLILSNCHYCNLPLTNTKTITSRCNHIEDMHWKYNGIDRVDSSKGYTKENSVPCCKFCNRAKMDDTETEFRAWLEHVRKGV